MTPPRFNPQLITEAATMLVASRDPDRAVETYRSLVTHVAFSLCQYGFSESTAKELALGFGVCVVDRVIAMNATPGIH
jgi:hypothetical protein